MSRMRSACKLALIVFALMATLGHICVLPGHAHAVPIAGNHDHDAAPVDDHGAPTDGASCEVLRSSGGMLAVPVLVAGPSMVAPVGTAPDLIARAAETQPPTASPPLYLTQHSLRI